MLIDSPLRGSNDGFPRNWLREHLSHKKIKKLKSVKYPNLNVQETDQSLKEIIIIERNIDINDKG